MDNLKKLVWGRGDAAEIMRRAHDQFQETVLIRPVEAYVTFASVNYSLVKRYVDTWWKKPIAVWHFWRALRSIDNAISNVTPRDLRVDQIDVITRIWSKSPAFLGGRINKAAALSMISYALIERSDEMKPHTRALLFITKGDLYRAMNQLDPAFDAYFEAESLLLQIEVEGSPDRIHQWARVATAVALFYIDHSGKPQDMEESIKLLSKALEYAREVGAKDQEEKIVVECRKRGLATN